MFDPVDWAHKLTEAAQNLADLIERGGAAVERARIEKAVRALRTLYFFDDGIIQDLRAVALPEPDQTPRLNRRRIDHFTGGQSRVTDALNALRQTDSFRADTLDIRVIETLRFIAIGKLSVRREIHTFLRHALRTGTAETVAAARLLEQIGILNQAISRAERVFVERYGLI